MVSCEIEVDLEHARRDELLDLAHDVVDGARALLAADLRDHAERARAVAALGDLHVGAARGRVRTRGSLGAHDPVGRVADEHALGARRASTSPSLSMSLEPRK